MDQFHQHTIRQQRADGSIKIRELTIPSEELKQEHRDMLHVLYDLDIPMPYATGGLPGKQLLHNVYPHINNDHFYMTDLTDAFGQVDTIELIDRARYALKSMGRPHNIIDWDQQIADIVEFIADKTSTDQAPGLPLGAPASPFLFNLYCKPMDDYLGPWCEERGITYTRYLDDLTFSAASPIGKKRRQQIRDIISVGGIPINHAKTKVHSLAKGPVTITGISLYPDRRIGPNPALMEKIKLAFREIGSLVTNGQLLYEEEEGRLHGYYGSLVQMSSTTTPTGHSLRAEYQAIIRLLEQ